MPEDINKQLNAILNGLAIVSKRQEQQMSIAGDVEKIRQDVDAIKDSETGIVTILDNVENIMGELAAGQVAINANLAALLAAIDKLVAALTPGPPTKLEIEHGPVTTKPPA